MRLAALIILFSFTSINQYGQKILIDEGIQVEGIWCFPLHDSPNEYKYLPNNLQLGYDNGLPKFSFLQFSIKNTGNENLNQVITQANGGAILNFIVELQYDEEKTKQANTSLKRKFGQEKWISGPVIFDEASFILISSIINPAGETERELLGYSTAPPLEGGNIAVSFRLSKEDAALMLESFQMATPDVSLIFDFGFSGLSNAFDGSIHVDWSEIYKYNRNKKKTGLVFFKSEVDKVSEELIQNKSIRVVNNGNDDRMEAFMERAYERIANMLFEPIDYSKYRDKKHRSPIVEGLKEIADHILDKTLISGILDYGFSSQYSMKDLRQEGTAELNFNSRSAAFRHQILAFNIGNLYKLYGDNELVFMPTIPLDLTTMNQREVIIGVDGVMAKDFDKILDNVTIDFRKVHQSGNTTVEQRLLRKGNKIEQIEDIPRIIYPNDKDTNLLEWFNYEYRATWYFKKNAKYETEWQKSNAAMINLFAPYECKKVRFVGNYDSFWEKGYQGIVVEIEYELFGNTIAETKEILPGSKEALLFEIVQPTGEFQLHYTVIGLTDGDPIIKTGQAKYGIIPIRL